jgi:putative DNA primase/helicase
VLRGVLGSQSVASPSIRSLSGQFGLWGLLDKSLAIIPDATMTSPSPALEELLKSISGEDPIDVHRKDLPPITSVRLPTRLMILANEYPRFRDLSGALASRILLLKTKKSFAEREDRLLSERLLSELSGILNWSIQGLRRLRRQGRFTQPLVVSTTRQSRSRKIREIVLELVDTLGLNQRKRPTNRRRPRRVRPK